MKAYGIDKKFLYNYKDIHPKKNKNNWWNVELKKNIKGRERSKNKINIVTVINDTIK